MNTLLLAAVLLQGDLIITDRTQDSLIVTDYTDLKKPRNERVLFFTMRNCGWCDKADKELREYMLPSGWKFGPQSWHDVQTVHYESDPQLFATYGVTSVPAFVAIKNGRELRRSHYKGRRTIVDLWPGSLTAPPEFAFNRGEYAPTPYPEIVRVLQRLLPKPKIAFVDFGCGADARWPITATELWGCRSIGIEWDHDRAESARMRVQEIGLDHLITIIEGDALTTKVDADVGVAFLDQETLNKLGPQIEPLKAFASYKHKPPVLSTKNGDSWVYQRPVVQAYQPVQQTQQYTQPYAVWQGHIYYQANPGCNCEMCREIRRQLGR